MERTIGKDIENAYQREAFLKDNADAAEEKGYMKPYTTEELQGHKEQLANVSIQIAEIEKEQEAARTEFKARMKPLKEARARLIDNIKNKAEYVQEVCYRFTDQEAKETGYYNKDGDLIELRPATADELQPTLFGQFRAMNNQQKDNNPEQQTAPAI